MGLDMYLKKRIFVGGNYAHQNVKGVIDLENKDGKLNIPLINLVECVLHEAYWRNADVIHNWFVTNIQHRDDCMEYMVDPSELQELVDICKKILKMRDDKDEDLLCYIEANLPPLWACYYEDSYPGEEYYNQLEETVTQLQNIETDQEYYYRSCW